MISAAISTLGLSLLRKRGREGAGAALMAAAVGLSFLNLHHFLMDGRVWKLRKPEVGKVMMQPATT